MTLTEKYLWGITACPLGYLFFENLGIVIGVGPEVLFWMTLFGGCLGGIIGINDIRKQLHASATSTEKKDNVKSDGPTSKVVTFRDGDDIVTCSFESRCIFCTEACPRFEANRDHGRPERQ